MARGAKHAQPPSLVLERAPHRSDGRNRRRKPRTGCSKPTLIGLAAAAIALGIAALWPAAPPPTAAAANTTAPLSPTAIASFERDGFLVLDSVVPPDLIAALLTELNAIKAEAEAEAEPSAGTTWDVNASGADASRCTFALARDRSGALLSPARLHKAQGIALRSPAVLTLLRLPPIARAAAALVQRALGPVEADAPPSRREVDAFGTKFFPASPGAAASVGWHDDNYYFGTTRSHTISCAVYLRAIDAATGCLRVLPGSHRAAAVGYGRAHLYVASESIPGEYIPEESLPRLGPAAAAEASGASSPSAGTAEGAAAGAAAAAAARAPLDVPVRAGSAVLFDANLLHAAHPNGAGGQQRSASERVAFHYIPGDLDTGFRATSFARGSFADRHLAVRADGEVPT